MVCSRVWVLTVWRGAGMTDLSADCWLCEAPQTRDELDVMSAIAEMKRKLAEAAAAGQSRSAHEGTASSRVC